MAREGNEDLSSYSEAWRNLMMGPDAIEDLEPDVSDEQVLAELQKAGIEPFRNGEAQRMLFQTK